MVGWLKVSSVQHICAYLLQRGITPAELLRSVGLPGSLLLDREAWIERGATLRLVAEMSRRTGDPWTGLHIAELQDLRHFDAWGRAVSQAPNLGQALHAAAANIQLIHEGTQLSLATTARRFAISAQFTGTLGGDPAHHYQDIAVVLTKVVRRATEPLALRISLTDPKPPIGDDEPERILRSEIEFGAPFPVVTFDRDALALPMLDAEVLDPLPPSDLLLKDACDVFDSVRRTILYQRPCIVDVAASLGIPLRTLQRNLQCWGLTFEQIVDEYRQMHALSELIRCGDSITDVAFRFGYSDSSHFTRAVRRWTGCSPRQFRLKSSHYVQWRVPLTGQAGRAAGLNES